MQTNIPTAMFEQMIQSKSPSATIVTLLNEAEEQYSPTRKNLRQKRIYPFWKVCSICGKPYPTFNHTQALRNKVCSNECMRQAMAVPRPQTRIPAAQRKMTLIHCAVCGKEKWVPNAWIRRIKTPTCSKKCNGVLRGQEWKKHAHKGRQSWTADSKASYKEKMTGAKNPAWKGGITYFKQHGNYTGIKYVRCPEEYLAMARKDGYVMEHRLIMAKSLKRCLSRIECVHHINHDTADNRIENLMLFKSNQEHKTYEGQERHLLQSNTAKLFGP